MVAMASDSYLLKVPQPPCQRCKTPARSTSCGVVVSLVLLVGAVLTLGVCGYLMMVQLCVARSELQFLKTKVEYVQTAVNRYNEFVQMRQFEIQSEDTPFPEPCSDEEEDDMEPTYPDPDYEVPFENKARDAAQDSASNVPLEPAGSLRSLLSGPATTADTTPVPSVEPTSAYPEEENYDYSEYDLEEAAAGRFRRDVGARRPDPQLKLYHMLQTPGVVPPPAAVEPWGYHDSYRAAPQPMYAEHAPMAFVAPPRPEPSTPMSPVLNRRSRVMDDTFTVSTPAPTRHHHRGRTGRRQRLQQQQQQQYPLQDVTQDVVTERSVESIDTTVEVDQTWRPYAPVVEGPAIAAHFVGDSARHRGTHHYDENGRLKHPTGEYADWRPTPWVRELGLDQHFRLAESGAHVTVDTPGLFLVYAQVNYANDKDENGFWVYRNGQKELLCAITGSSGSSGSSSFPRANTCFTAGVLHLSKGDRVSLRDLAGDRYRVLDHPGRSFIGLVNLSACKLKSEQQGPSRVTA